MKNELFVETDSERAAPEEGAADSNSIRLQGQQSALYEGLEKWHIDLCTMYLGAIHVLNSDNPDRISLCCHGIREIVEKLPQYTDVPVFKGERQKLGNLVGVLKNAWTYLTSKTTWPGNPKWTEPIDDHLRGFLDGCENFFIRNEEVSLSQKEIARRLIRKHGYSDVPLPVHIENESIAIWLNLKSYFTNTSHHKRSTDAELRANLGQFEIFLLGMLQPAAAEAQDELDRLIEEGEKNAH